MTPFTQSEAAWIAREYARGQLQVEIATELDLSQAYVCISIERFCSSLGYPVKYKHYGPHRADMARQALARYQGEFTRPTNARNRQFELLYVQARREHAWLLRAEGLTLQQIGDRLGGLGREGVRQIIHKFSRRVQRATRKTRFKILKEAA